MKHFNGMMGILSLACICVVSLSAQNPVIVYGHLSYVENGVHVLRAGQTAPEIGRVNLPIVAGDTIVTPADARCEIQSDNGTIIRLDRDSELKLINVRSAIITEKGTLTTMQLQRGAFFTVNKVYGKEIVQLQTANAALRLNSNCKSLVCVGKDGDTQIKTIAGKVNAMAGNDDHSLHTKAIRSGQEIAVANSGQFVDKTSPVSDFQLWNQYMDKNFNDLHKGINELPKAIQQYSPGVVAWAEKWSTGFGRWVNNATLGYVWQPYDSTFIDDRPFYNAEFVTIDGQLFMVPQEPWGYLPANLGAWRWLPSEGWTWIPGDAFDRALDFDTYCRFFSYWRMLPNVFAFEWEQVYSLEFSWMRQWRNASHHYPGNPGSPAPLNHQLKPFVATATPAIKFVRDWNPDVQMARLYHFDVRFDTARNGFYSSRLGLHASPNSASAFRQGFDRAGGFSLATTGKGNNSSNGSLSVGSGHAESAKSDATATLAKDKH